MAGESGFFDRFVLEFQAGNWLLLLWLTALLASAYWVARRVTGRRGRVPLVIGLGAVLALALLGVRFAAVWAGTSASSDSDLEGLYLKQAITGWALTEIHSNLARACPRYGGLDDEGEPLMGWLERRFTRGMTRIRRAFDQAAGGLVDFPVDFAVDGASSATYEGVRPLVVRFVVVVWEEDLRHRCGPNR